MTSKLALHVQQHKNWTANSHAAWIKVIDPPEQNKWPRHQIVGRVYIPDGEANAMIARGAAGAEEWFRRVLPGIQRAPYVMIWELPNEPQPVAELAFCHQLADFTLRVAALLHGIGKKVVGGNLSEGNPGGNEQERRERFVAIARGLAACDWWSQHCYWVLDYPHTEAGMNDWHAYRYRLNMRYAREAGIKLPRLMLTEVGIDGGVVGVKAKGWRTFCQGNWQAYQAQLAQFDSGLHEDPDVEAAFIFTAGANADWTDFAVGEWENAQLDAYIDAQGGPYVPKAAQPPPAANPGTLGEALRAEFGAAGYEDLTTTLAKHAMLRYGRRALAQIDRVVIHHTDARRDATWQAVARYHVEQNDWPGIGYHVGVQTRAGGMVVSLLNAPETVSYHAHQVGNERGVAVCIAGQFEQTAPSAAEVETLRRVVAVIRRWATWRHLAVQGHGDVPGNDTACPGASLAALLPTISDPVATIDRAVLLAAADAAQVMRLNPQAALQKRIFEDGFVPTSPEFEIAHDARVYIAQRAEHLRTGAVRVYYCLRGQWDAVRYEVR